MYESPLLWNVCILNLVQIYKKLTDVTDRAYKHYCGLTKNVKVDRSMVEEQVRLETMSRELSVSKYRRLKEELAVCGKLGTIGN